MYRHWCYGHQVDHTNVCSCACSTCLDFRYQLERARGTTKPNPAEGVMDAETPNSPKTLGDYVRNVEFWQEEVKYREGQVARARTILSEVQARLDEYLRANPSTD
jgi:hypothetical protein